MGKYAELYQKLYNKIYPIPNKQFKETELSNFVAMRGKRYNEKLNKDGVVRLMVVGRAVNGWGKAIDTTSADTYAKEATKLFKQEDRFQTEWKMKNGETNPYSEYEKTDENNKKIIKEYHLSKSPFWSGALQVYQELSKKEPHEHTDWYEDIVWNNIYKVAPAEGGNPSTNLIYAQAPTCVELLKEEIKLLKPTHVLLVIDKSWVSWTSRNKVMFDFMEAFDNRNRQCQTVLEEQNKAIVQCAFTVDKCKVLITCRPENVLRDDYKNAVIDAFNGLQN